MKGENWVNVSVYCLSEWLPAFLPDLSMSQSTCTDL